MLIASLREVIRNQAVQIEHLQNEMLKSEKVRQKEVIDASIIILKY